MKHILLTIIIVVPIIFLIGILSGNVIKYGGNKIVRNLNNEGPYIFYANDSLINISYIIGDEEKGYDLKTSEQLLHTPIILKSYYALDSTNFSFKINPHIDIPKNIYNDGRSIIAVSDIEGNYKSFRDFLINSSVIDENLNWIFGEGHLVLLGDFIDRGYFSTQVLWFIYKLEQDARNKGGNVHFILGNHEIMNMRGNHSYATPKYNYVSSVLEIKQFELYGHKSFIGKWLESKNTLEIINGNLFVHGGVHPNLLDAELDIDLINNSLREKYFKSYYPKLNSSNNYKLLHSNKTSPFWYRGYFRDNIEQKDIDKLLNKLKCNHIIVGHTVQKKINKIYEGRIIAIDVKHPQDHYKYWPKQKSEGLLIEGDRYFRLYDNGKKKKQL